MLLLNAQPFSCFSFIFFLLSTLQSTVSIFLSHLCHFSVYFNIYLHSKPLSSLLSHWLTHQYEFISPFWLFNPVQKITICLLIGLCWLLQHSFKKNESTNYNSNSKVLNRFLPYILLQKMVSCLSLYVPLGAFLWICHKVQLPFLVKLFILFNTHRTGFIFLWIFHPFWFFSL